MLLIGSQVKIQKPDHPLHERVGRVVSIHPMNKTYRVVIYHNLDMESDVFLEEELELLKRTGYF